MIKKRFFAAFLCLLFTLTACGSRESGLMDSEDTTASSGSSIVEFIPSQTEEFNSTVSEKADSSASSQSSSAAESKAESKKSTDKDTEAKATETDSDEESNIKETDSENETSENSSETVDDSDNEQSEESKTMTPICRSALVYCVDDDSVLYNDCAEDTVAPASLTKLLTAAVVLEHLDPNDVVTVGDELYMLDPESSLCYISIGNQLTVHDLLTGMLLRSGNDAAYTAAVTTARAAKNDPDLSGYEAISAFADLMNGLASKIGMKNSHFVVPDGLDNSDQYTTAADLERLAEYTLEIPEIRSIVGMYEASVTFESGESVYWTNTNQLINPYSGFYCADAVGMKTGTTGAAGACLIAAVEKNEKTYITVVSGCYADSDRFELTNKLIDMFCK